MTPVPKHKLWRSKPYREWVEKQPSIWSRNMDSYQDKYGNRIMRNEAHHYRKGSDGGTGMKPSDSYCVPLTHEEHRLVENGNIVLGESDVIRICLRQITEYLAEHRIK